MMIEHQDERYRSKIRDYLIHRACAVRVDADRNLLNLAALSESFYVEFLNVLLDLRLENANTSERNAPGIDLIDRKNQVVAQVSITCTPNTIRQKIQHSIDKFDKPEGVWQFYFVPITDEAPRLGKNFHLPDGVRFDRNKDVLDIPRILELARGTDKLEKLAALVDLYSEEKHDFSELRKTLDNLLLQTWRKHRSYKLMQTEEIDRRLFPGVQDSHQFEALGKRGDDDIENPVWSIIRDSWREPGNRSVVIEGKGGVGKTVTLFSIANIKKDMIPAPSVYVPAFDLIAPTGEVINLTDYFQSSYSFASLTMVQRREICMLAAEDWNQGPKLLVLLDGFNEVPGPRRWDLLHMLRKWHRSNPGAQLIAVSRPMDNLNLEAAFGDQTIFIKLSPLTIERVASYLNSHQGEGVQLPQPIDPIWDTIVYPLFLNLYIKTNRFQNQRAWKDYPLEIRNVTGPGSIIWNYLQRELLRHDDESWILRCALACEYFAPIIAYYMLQRFDYTITLREAIEIIRKASLEMDFDRMPAHISNLFSWWRVQTLSMDMPIFLRELNWPEIVLRECGLLVPFRDIQTESRGKKSEERFEFLHQNFRDCLAGIYLVNQVEMSREGEYPSVWRIRQCNLAMGYAAELITPVELDKLWEVNREAQQSGNAKSLRNHTATCNLLELYKRNKKNIKGLDFSGMNLCGLSLVNYLGKNGAALPLFRDKAHSINTAFDRTCFQSNGHTNSILVLTILSDGRVVSGSSDSTLRVWDIATGQCLQTLEGHETAVRCVAVLLDGRVVSGSNDCTLRVWDAATGQCLQTLQGHSNFVTCVAVLPDGRVVSGSNDGTLRVWDAATGQCLQTLKGHSDWVICVVILPDGRVVSGSSDCTLRVWDAVTGQCLQILEGHSNYITCIASFLDGRIVSGSNDCTLRVWDSSTGQCLQTLKGHSDWVICVVALLDGRVVSGSSDNALRVWDATTGQCLQTLEGHYGSVNSVAVLPDGGVVSGSDDSALREWDISAGSCLNILEGHNWSVTCIAVLPDGNLISGSDDSTLRVWDVASGQCLQTLEGHERAVRCVAVLPDGRAVSGSDDRTLRVWDVASGQCWQILKGHSDYVSCVAVLPDGRVVSGSRDSTIWVWDATTGQCLQILNGHRSSVLCIEAFPDGRLISGSRDSTLRVWDAASGQCLQTLIGHSNIITCVAVLPDGRVVSGSNDRTLRVWDAATGKCLQTHDGYRNSVTCVTVLQDGQVVYGSSDNCIYEVDTKTGQSLHTLRGHGDLINCMTVLHDGHVVSGSDDGTLRVWDCDTGICLDVLEMMEIRVSKLMCFRMDFSNALLTKDLSQLLWHNGALISPNDYERWVKPFRYEMNEASMQRKSRPRRLPLPVGNSDYREASTKYYYVDKTMLIKDFLDDMPSVSLFTRPRRFGKTLNMDMLRTFFEKTNEDTSVYFRDKYIWRQGKYYQQFQGQYPVIFVTFKDVKCNTWDNTLEKLKEIIGSEFIRHSDLLSSDECNDFDKECFSRIMRRNATETELSGAFLLLTRMLHSHYKSRKPIIIIDEYDTPIQQGHAKGFYNQVISFMRNLFSSCLKDNRHLSFGFLTGILRIAKESIFSGMNNIITNTIMDEKYSSYFGFTRDEVQTMATYYNAKHKVDELLLWYDGYRFGSNDIFNPWSVINYFRKDCVLEAYWQSTGSNEIIGEILEEAGPDVIENLQMLLQGKSFPAEIDLNVIYPRIRESPATIYSFLLVAGYLSAQSVDRSFGETFMCEVALPNQEITAVFKKEILEKLTKMIPSSAVRAIHEAITTGNAQELQDRIRQFLCQSVSFYDTAGENFYHGLILGLCALMSNRYEVRSNRESGDGRYDIQLTPRESKLPGILIELKAAKKCTKEELDKLAQTAIKQIEEKNYATDLNDRGVWRIIKYGVAFQGKNVVVRMKSV